MSYVRHVLQPGEVVRHTASLHWIFYVRGILLCIVAGVIFTVLPQDGGLIYGVGLVVAFLLLAVSLAMIAHTWYVWWTTEIAVTDRRIIYKTGLIYRETSEMNMDKV